VRFQFASRRRMRSLLAFGLAAATCTAAGLFLQFGAAAQGTADGTQAPAAESAPERAPTPSMVRTDSPRQTLASFLRLRDELEAALGAYRQETTILHAVRLADLTEQMRSLFDFSEVPVASRQQIGGETGAYVLDILGRIGLPNLDDVPDLAVVEAEGLTRYAVPDTPLRITRIEEGPRAGEFLFSAQTVDTAPRFYRGIAGLPLRSSLPIESWISEVRQLTGPMIPAVLVAAVPDFMKQPVLGTPIWKILAVILVVLLAVLVLAFLHRVIAASRPGRKRAALWRRTLSPLAIIAAAFAIWRFSAIQINVSGQFAWALDVAMTIVGYLGLAWAIWLVSLALFETIVRSKDFPEENLDADMLRLVARIVGVAGIVFVLAMGAQTMGLPVVSVLAGLGIGGLAVALAIRPTLENLIGGFILYLDKPIRVGDFCNFGTQSGTVERIGVRSTQIRALDRTLITVPNAQFADMQIVNWARCDQMLIEQIVRLRYETSGDQLRFVLAKIREMFHAHPRIDDETVRVRLATYGPSSLDVLIRVYAKTREWNDFFAVKEDVLLRVKEIVEQSGTGFAFPSQTLYLGKDAGLDEALSEKAVQQVAGWRRMGRLPFPRFAAGALEKLTGSLNYPPRGSPDFNATEEELAEAGDERLSAEPLQRESAEPTEEEAAEDAQKRG
jgi:MscS family membrane protein